VTKPDEALLWARENMAKWCEENDEHQLAQTYRSGAEDIRLIDEVRGYRAGAAASEARIKALEALLGHFLGLYCGSAFWDVEKEPEVIEAIALLNDAEARALLKEGDQ